MTEQANQAEAGAVDNTLSFELADKVGDSAVSVAIDLSKIPAATRRELLEQRIKQLVNGRPHQAVMAFNKAQAEYKAKCDADPTFDGTAPTAPNLAEIAQGAITDMYEGKLRQRGKGTGKQAEAKDPVDAVVTQAVIRELFQKRKAEKPGTKYQEVVKEVGVSGIKYLEARAETLSNGDEKRKAELLKTLENKYIKPARQMVSVNAKGEQQENELL